MAHTGESSAADIQDVLDALADIANQLQAANERQEQPVVVNVPEVPLPQIDVHVPLPEKRKPVSFSVRIVRNKTGKIESMKVTEDK